MSDESNGDMPEGATTEEILFSKPDSSYAFNVSAKLITYPDGTMDLFRQPGNEFDAHIAEATAILHARGLTVGNKGSAFKTGMYLPVMAKLSEQPDLVVPRRLGPASEATAPFESQASLVNMVFTDPVGRDRTEHRLVGARYR